MINAKCWGHINPGRYYSKDHTETHEFTADEAARLLGEMSGEDWEDGPRCLRHYLDRVVDGQWGYRPYDHHGSLAVDEHAARRKVYSDHALILTYRPKPDAPWEDVTQWGDNGPVNLGPGPGRVGA